MYMQTSLVENKQKDNTNMTLRSANKIKLKTDFTSKTKVYNVPFCMGLGLWDMLPADPRKEDKNSKGQCRIISVLCPRLFLCQN